MGVDFVGRRCLVPVRRLFPIWRYGRLYRGWGWYADWFATREFASPEEADAFIVRVLRRPGRHC